MLLHGRIHISTGRAEARPSKKPLLQNGHKGQNDTSEGCSKMLSCKAREVMRNEAYFPYAAITSDERNEADERFSTAFH